ncbi:MAG: GNAT family N-acetyltransferase [Candidatus Promineifilaceae bacterium]|nr:GNAT family N-acetyltransferase [Candidatus Promineifilaceae bacterium]
MNAAPARYIDDTLILHQVTDGDAERWDQYVRDSSAGLPLHLSGWRQVMQATYNYKTHYLLAQDQGQIVGVMPFFLVPSFLTGKRAMTMPGGVCADNESIAVKLVQSGIETAADEGIDKVFIQDSRQIPLDNWSSESNHVYWLLTLGANEEELWKKLDGNIRRQVRKAQKNNLTVDIDRTGDLLDPFYDVFSRFTHQVGTPVFGRQFLENTINFFPGGFNIAVVWYKKRPIAAYFQLQMNDTVYGMWGAALPETIKLRPSYIALWEIMRDAIENGYHYLDMGRSPAASNASKFKGQWGGTSFPIYQTIINGNRKEPVRSVTGQVQSNDQFKVFMKIWSKMPLSLTRRLGPKLRWHVPFA